MPGPKDTTRPFGSAIESVDLDLDMLTQGILTLREELSDRNNGKAHFMLEGMDLLVKRAASALEEAFAIARAQGVK